MWVCVCLCVCVLTVNFDLSRRSISFLIYQRVLNIYSKYQRSIIFKTEVVLFHHNLHISVLIVLSYSTVEWILSNGGLWCISNTYIWEEVELRYLPIVFPEFMISLCTYATKSRKVRGWSFFFPLPVTAVLAFLHLVWSSVSSSFQELFWQQVCNVF